MERAGENPAQTQFYNHSATSKWKQKYIRMICAIWHVVKRCTKK